MKSEVVNNCVEQNVNFPTIARNIGTKAIWLIASRLKGTLLVKEESGYEVGESISDLRSFPDIKYWEILDNVTINFKS